ncbi:MAG TPA: ATP-binding protein [Micromonosporaceae bacterium]
MLVERGDFLASLRGLLGEAVDGSGRLVFLGGEAGVGKTALAACHIPRWPSDSSCPKRRWGINVSAVLRKLGEPTRSRAVATALRHGIIPPR